MFLSTLLTSLEFIFIFRLNITFIYYILFLISVVECCTGVCVLSSIGLSSVLRDDGLFLVGRGVATDLHRNPLAAEDQRRGRWAVQGLQLLLCNMVTSHDTNSSKVCFYRHDLLSQG